MWGFGRRDVPPPREIAVPRPFVAPPVRYIQPGSITLSGVGLETQVAVTVMRDIEWTLDRMQVLMIRLNELGFTVSLHTCRSGWACDVKEGDILGPDDEMVREFGQASPAIALARGALAAVREWPR